MLQLLLPPSVEASNKKFCLLQFSQPKLSYGNVFAIAASTVAGIFCRNMHCAIRLITYMWQISSFSISFRKGALVLCCALCKSCCHSHPTCNAIAASGAAPEARTLLYSCVQVSLPFHNLTPQQGLFVGRARSWAAMTGGARWVVRLSCRPAVS